MKQSSLSIGTRKMSKQSDHLDEQWQRAQAGDTCYLCAPREANNEHRFQVVSLSISTLYLYGDQRFRGYCLLIFDARHATSLDQLREDEYTAYMRDLRDAARALRSVFRPDHMNYECLGNTSPHLHWHIIPRYRSDPRWGQPVWEGWPRNEFTVNRFALSQPEYGAMTEEIRVGLKRSRGSL